MSMKRKQNTNGIALSKQFKNASAFLPRRARRVSAFH